MSALQNYYKGSLVLNSNKLLLPSKVYLVSSELLRKMIEECTSTYSNSTDEYIPYKIYQKVCPDPKPMHELLRSYAKSLEDSDDVVEYGNCIKEFFKNVPMMTPIIEYEFRNSVPESDWDCPSGYLAIKSDIEEFISNLSRNEVR